MPPQCKCIVGALASAAIPNIGGIVGGYYARDGIKVWYKGLKKPGFTPPDWAFGPVWTGLYAGIGYASYLVYKEGGGFSGPAQLPLISYGVNLAINWAWTPLFFNMHRLDLALYEIILLDASTLFTGYLFYQVNKTAGYLFIPYAAWLSLATALTYRIFKDNPSKGKITEIKE